MTTSELPQAYKDAVDHLSHNCYAALITFQPSDPTKLKKTIDAAVENLTAHPGHLDEASSANFIKSLEDTLPEISPSKAEHLRRRLKKGFYTFLLAISTMEDRGVTLSPASVTLEESNKREELSSIPTELYEVLTEFREESPPLKAQALKEGPTKDSAVTASPLVTVATSRTEELPVGEKTNPPIANKLDPSLPLVSTKPAFDPNPPSTVIASQKPTSSLRKPSLRFRKRKAKKLTSNEESVQARLPKSSHSPLLEALEIEKRLLLPKPVLPPKKETLLQMIASKIHSGNYGFVGTLLARAERTEETAALALDAGDYFHSSKMRNTAKSLYLIAYRANPMNLTPLERLAKMMKEEGSHSKSSGLYAFMSEKELEGSHKGSALRYLKSALKENPNQPILEERYKDLLVEMRALGRKRSGANR